MFNFHLIKIDLNILAERNHSEQKQILLVFIIYQNKKILLFDIEEGNFEIQVVRNYSVTPRDYHKKSKYLTSNCAWYDFFLQ